MHVIAANRISQNQNQNVTPVFSVSLRLQVSSPEGKCGRLRGYIIQEEHALARLPVGLYYKDLC